MKKRSRIRHPELLKTNIEKVQRRHFGILCYWWKDKFGDCVVHKKVDENGNTHFCRDFGDWTSEFVLDPYEERLKLQYSFETRIYVSSKVPVSLVLYTIILYSLARSFVDHLSVTSPPCLFLLTCKGLVENSKVCYSEWDTSQISKWGPSPKLIRKCIFWPRFRRILP